MKAEVFSNEFLQVIVPENWKAFLGIDAEGKTTQKKLHIYKNAENELDIFHKAGITICYYEDAGQYLLIKDLYDDINDIPSFELGNYCWSGYTCRSFGYPYIMLESSEKTDRVLLMILTENGENKISFSDSDVQEIIKSIVAGKREEKQ
ncbi:MAG: hypothetical protein J6L65_07115 [Lachnospiraceae bacterium]|nr:hypothetical protein [Lachnospiraceae bacterium]